MSRMEKAPEPSMEDILASIRKIIAEEPIGSRRSPGTAPVGARANGGQPAPSQQPAARVQPAGQQPTPAPRRPLMQPAAIDDVLSLADDVPTVRHGTTPTPASGATPSKTTAAPVPAQSQATTEAAPAWLFPKETTAAVTTPAASPARGSAPSPLPAPAPFFGVASASNASKTEAVPADAMVPPQPKTGLSDLGSFVPGRMDHGGLGAPFVRPEPSPLKASSLSSLNGDKPGSAPQAQTRVVPAPAPAMPPVVAAPSPAVTDPQPKTETPKPEDGQGEPVAAKPMPASDAKPDVKPGPQTQAARPATEPAAAAAAANKLLAPVAAAKPAADMVVPTVAAPAAPMLDKRPAIVPETATPVLLGTPLPAPVALAPKTAVAPATASASPMPMNAIEERVVELLRPMIRDWLDNNMPRMVEKALSIELSASAKPKNAPTRN